MELQGLIARGRFVFRGADARFAVFKSVSGRDSATRIAMKTRRSQSSVLHDLRKLADVGLIEAKRGKNGDPIKKDGSIVYEKVPLARQIPLRYFQDTVAAAKRVVKPPRARQRSGRQTRPRSLPVPSENRILEACSQGEDEVYEFKESWN